MPPIVSIIGKSKSGKTTLIEKLIRELKSRGYRVATIKHTNQKLTFDEPGKDSWRHIQAGSEATMISSQDRIVLIKPVAKDISLEEIAHLVGEDYDIILTEGFRESDAPKIEVHRKGADPPFATTKKLIAIATDEPLETKTRQFSLDDIKGLADLLEKGFIKPQRERVTLYVNNAPISLSSFPKQIIGNILLAIASSLTGVKEVRSLEIFLMKEPKPAEELMENDRAKD
jgi:molybdopterin-guanine dinucleotide biosynthesis protein B